MATHAVIPDGRHPWWDFIPRTDLNLKQEIGRKIVHKHS